MRWGVGEDNGDTHIAETRDAGTTWRSACRGHVLTKVHPDTEVTCSTCCVIAATGA